MTLPGTFTGDRVPAPVRDAVRDGPSLALSGRGRNPNAGGGLLPAHTRPANTRVATVLGRGAAAFGRRRGVAPLAAGAVGVFLGLGPASCPGRPCGHSRRAPSP